MVFSLEQMLANFFLELFMCVVLNTNFRASLRLTYGIV